MGIRIYNSLTREKEDFIPIEKGAVKMYVCGPTVYDEPHIGHARGAFVFDVVRNYFRYRQYKVKYVRNVTDVDDKIIDKARMAASSGGGLKAAVEEIAQKYLARYDESMAALAIGRPDVEPRATEHIEDMLELIRGLMEKGYAYEASGDVYFRVRKFSAYGKLSHQCLDLMAAGARVAPDEHKEDPLDFALWKKSKEEEPSWRARSSGDGRPVIQDGRPGWHIECSAMSMKHLGGNFDIHGGGLDLIFPHHENEIAQSESYSGKRFANYWMHNGLLTINGQKMSKSLGNYLSVSDFLAGHKDSDILKIFFLSSHYRTPVDFTDEAMAAAKSAVERLRIFLTAAEDFASGSKNGPPESAAEEFLRAMSRGFKEAMDDDFSTPQALAVLFDAVTAGNSVMNSAPSCAASDRGLCKMSDDRKKNFIGELVFKIKEMSCVLGLGFARRNVSAGTAAAVEKKIKMREEARRNKNYKLADEIRNDLEKMGIAVEDTKDGPKWRVK